MSIFRKFCLPQHFSRKPVLVKTGLFQCSFTGTNCQLKNILATDNLALFTLLITRCQEQHVKWPGSRGKETFLERSGLLNGPFCVDPTFNFGKLEATLFSFEHLLLKSARTNEAPVFIRPTALHYSKSAVLESCPALSRKTHRYVTDREKALSDALGETIPKATGVKCFSHFTENCKSK